MVSSINPNSAILYERINAAKSGMHSYSNIANVKNIADEIFPQDYINSIEDYNYSSNDTITDENLKDFEIPPANDDWFITYGSSAHISSLEEYTHARQLRISGAAGAQAMNNSSNSAERNLYSSKYSSEAQKLINNIDYQAEYDEYMKLRGCDNQQELEILNTTSYRTKNDLYFWVELGMRDIYNSLHEEGLTNAEQIDWHSIVSKIDLKDIVDYSNSKNHVTNFKGFVNCFKTFIDKLSKQNGVDEALKISLTNLSKDIRNASDAISVLSDKMDEESKKNEESAELQKQKYNTSLIANYKN